MFEADEKLRMMVHCFAFCWCYLNDTLLLMINREVHRRVKHWCHGDQPVHIWRDMVGKLEEH